MVLRGASLVENSDNHLGPEAVAALGRHLAQLLNLHVLDISSKMRWRHASNECAHGSNVLPDNALGVKGAKELGPHLVSLLKMQHLHLESAFGEAKSCLERTW